MLPGNDLPENVVHGEIEIPCYFFISKDRYLCKRHVRFSFIGSGGFDSRFNIPLAMTLILTSCASVPQHFIVAIDGLMNPGSLHHE
jgi:hypothetical protein